MCNEKRGGSEKLAVVGCNGTLAIEIGLVFNFSDVFLSTYSIFSAKYTLFGNWHVNRQGAPNCSVRFPVLNKAGVGETEYSVLLTDTAQDPLSFFIAHNF